MRNAKLWLRCGQANAAAADEDDEAAAAAAAAADAAGMCLVVVASTFVATDVNVCIVEILIAFT